MTSFKMEKLKNITLKIGSGSTPRGGEAVYIQDGITLIRSQNIYDYKFEKDGLVYLDYKEGQLLRNVTIEQLDILLNITGDSVGRCCTVPNELLPARVNQHVCIIRVNTTNSPEYVMYALNERKNKERLLNLVHGGTRKALTKGVIEEFEISLPAFTTQVAIASILKKVDAKIELNRNINQTLEQMAQTLYKHWFVDFGPFKDSEFEESELGDIPNGWKVQSLKDIALIIMGQSPKSEFYNVDYEGLPFHQGVTGFEERFPQHTVYSSKILRVANENDILTSVRAPVGRINIAPSEMVIGRGLAAIRPKDNNYSFLLYTLKNIFKSEDSHGSGTIFNSINKSELENLKVTIPNPNIIDLFEEKVKKWDKLYKINSEIINQLIDTRDYLLPRLLSGEIEVKEAANMIKEVLAVDKESIVRI
ncbi:restriction endonuclease subunit S [Paenibacillus agricola]|uniref:Restriction endonuclease subunit S n=1 Tax=Paenibacillus agricola TaxID=2716264 RepID=A0ABX0JLE0_9BACL|nr:restriction endonuclease subunit S [Paenibacillus agricola]NHN34830.1 restriction endonuclease subunit S [Paenibacillus agricola]